MSDGPTTTWFWWLLCERGDTLERARQRPEQDLAWIHEPCPTCGSRLRYVEPPPRPRAIDVGTVNRTRAALRDALRRAGGDWGAALPEVAAWLRAGFQADRRGFVAAVVHDLTVAPAPALRELTMQALDDSPTVAAALRRVREAIDERENPSLAGVVWRETRQQIAGALYRALRAEDQACAPSTRAPQP